MLEIDKDLFFLAASTCVEETTALIAEFGVTYRIDNHISKIMEYGKSVKDLEKGITVEDLQKGYQMSLRRLKVKFFALNKASRKATGHYLFGKLESDDALAEEMYDWLLDVI